MTQDTNLIAEKSLGTRTIMNTNFGRTAYVIREQWGLRPQWTVTVVCNGIADYSKTYKTRREALEDFETL